MNNSSVEKTSLPPASAIAADAANFTAMLFRSKQSSKAKICFLLLLLTLFASVAEVQAGNSKSKSGAKIDSRRNQINISADNLWRALKEVPLSATQAQQMLPRSYRAFHLNADVLSQLLSRAPMEMTRESSNASVEMNLPMPDGTFSRFRIEESPIMEPELAAKFPEIKTYQGFGLDDPTATMRFDRTPSGFHAMVISSKDTIYVDPFESDRNTYYSYYKHDHITDEQATKGLLTNVLQGFDQPLAASVEVPQVVYSNGRTMREYRIAIGATFEYTQSAGGTVQAALARITTTMNRINEIFMRELVVKMVLVANEDKVIYTTSQQPYSNKDTIAQLDQNQKNLDTVIGSANYDIGHVFSTASGGVAQNGVVCSATSKAKGNSGSSTNTTGDSFIVDIVSQEIAHQFNTLHTFNGTLGGCSGNNRTPDSACNHPLK